jgi:hypothetical protein
VRFKKAQGLHRGIRCHLRPLDPPVQRQFGHDPLEESVDARVFRWRKSWRSDASDHNVLSETPGMGYELAKKRLAATQIG